MTEFIVMSEGRKHEKKFNHWIPAYMWSQLVGLKLFFIGCFTGRFERVSIIEHNSYKDK